MNDDVMIKRIALILSENEGVDGQASARGHIVITIKGRQGNPNKQLIADYVRYVRSPLSGYRYLIAGSGPPTGREAIVSSFRKKRWLYKLRDFYKAFYYGRRQAYRPRFAKIMTIKAENVLAVESK